MTLLQCLMNFNHYLTKFNIILYCDQALSETSMPLVSMSFLSQDRRRRIISEVFKRKHVTARDLAEQMEVSEATVRRDFKALADSGQVDLVYGGATLARNTDYSFGSKAKRNLAAKRAIAALAVGFISDNDQLLLDSGTTCFEVASLLKN